MNLYKFCTSEIKCPICNNILIANHIKDNHIIYWAGKIDINTSFVKQDRKYKNKPVSAYFDRYCLNHFNYSMRVQIKKDKIENITFSEVLMTSPKQFRLSDNIMQIRSNGNLIFSLEKKNFSFLDPDFNLKDFLKKMDKLLILI